MIANAAFYRWVISLCSDQRQDWSLAAGCHRNLPDAIIMEFVIAGESDETSPRCWEWEEDLNGSILPHLGIGETGHVSWHVEFNSFLIAFKQTDDIEVDISFLCRKYIQAPHLPSEWQFYSIHQKWNLVLSCRCQLMTMQLYNACFFRGLYF